MAESNVPPSPPPPPPAPPGARKRPARAWSVYIFTIAGIPVYLHYTFLMLMLWIAGAQGAQGLLLLLFVFGSVALHELGHAMAARVFGIRTEDIVLYPIGGVARLRSMGEGLQEFWIAVAGPMVNLVIAAALWIWLGASRGDTSFWSIVQKPDEASLAESVFAINLMLLGFNLIPAFPMDGGRVLRSLLTQLTSKENATAIAARIGQAFAVLFAVVGLLTGNFIIAIIGIFVFIAAGQEDAMTRTQALVRGHYAHEAMITHFEVLQHGDTLGQAADLLLTTSQQDFPVMLGSEVEGVLSRRKLLEGLAARGREDYLAAWVERDFPHLSVWDDLRRAYELMMDPRAAPVLVFDGEKLVGIITHENIMEFMMVERLGRRA